MRHSPFLIAALLLGAAGAAGAQDSDHAEAGACAGGTVSVVFVDNHSIFDTTDPDLDARFAWAYRVANALHFRTREAVIRRELLVAPGDCYDPAVLEETERLLRAHDFLSHVDVFGVLQPDSTYHVVVDTQDEWSTRVDLRVKLEGGLNFEGIRVRESNLIGTGRAVELFYLERDANRDYGATYLNRQLFGSRWDLSATAGRTRAGIFLGETIAYPFVGEAGRWAAREGFRWHDRFFDYVIDDGGEEAHVLLPVRDKGFDLTLVGRAGRVGQLTSFGAGLSYAELGYPDAPGSIDLVRDDDYGDAGSADSATVAPVLRQTEPLNALRLLFLIGRRSIGWVKREGLDAMKGEQDVRLGTEAELAFGRSLPGRRDDNDLFTTLTLYGAAESGELLSAGRLLVDSRRDFGAARRTQWEDVFADTELLAYWRPEPQSAHTVVLRAAGTGGWHTRTPYQITLGGDRGVRGYDRNRFPGGRRLVFTLEDRIYFGWPFREVLDIGGTVFFDVGRIWPGDAPYGVDSGWRSSIGLGLRNAFPAGGRTNYRIDLALPLERGAGWKDLRLILSVGELLGLSARAPVDRLGDDRQVGAAGNLFHFPD